MASCEVERRFIGDLRSQKPNESIELYRVFPNITDTYYSFNPFVRVRYAECNYPKNITISELTSKQELSGELDETEITIEDTNKINKIISLLKSVVIVVSGSREEYKSIYNNLSICFDYVNRLGYATEIEKIVENPKEIPQAVSEIEKAFKDFFGIDTDKMEKRIYPEILFQHKREYCAV